MQLNEAVSRRLVELMQERGMTQYQLYMKSGVPKSTIGNLVNCAYCFNPFRRAVNLFGRPPRQTAYPAALRSSSA